jgi:hypothetical protein
VLRGVAIHRVDDGKLMERWVVSDLHGVLEEIGGAAALPSVRQGVIGT